MTDDDLQRPDSCPRCGSPEVARIIWGCVEPTSQIWQDLKTGRAVLAGCYAADPKPAWECQACDHRWS